MKRLVKLFSFLLLCFLLVSEVRVALISCLPVEQSISYDDEAPAQADAENEGEERTEDSNEAKEKFFSEALSDATAVSFSLSSNGFYYNSSCKCNPHFEVISPPPQLVC